MVVLSLDVSTNTGWSIFEDGALLTYGVASVEVLNFNPNDKPETKPNYPYNLIDASYKMATCLMRIVDIHEPDIAVLEASPGSSINVHSQRLLEFIHKSILEKLKHRKVAVKYINIWEWRQAVGLVLSKNDKQNNKIVKLRKTIAKLKESGSKWIDEEVELFKLESKVSPESVKGRVTSKHLSVRKANELFGLSLKQKDNDIADSLCMGQAACILGIGNNIK